MLAQSESAAIEPQDSDNLVLGPSVRSTIRSANASNNCSSNPFATCTAVGLTTVLRTVGDRTSADRSSPVSFGSNASTSGSDSRRASIRFSA